MKEHGGLRNSPALYVVYGVISIKNVQKASINPILASKYNLVTLSFSSELYWRHHFANYKGKF